MNPDKNNPQSGGENLQKLEDDLQKITKEAASTAPPTPVVPTQPIAEQPVTFQQTDAPVQPIEVPPAPPDVPVENTKKGVSVMTVAIVLLIVAMLVAVGYVVYAKFIVPAPVVQPQVQIVPTDTPLPVITPQASSSATPTATPFLSPTPSASSSASPIP